MARELEIRITADNTQAVAKLAETEKSVEGVTSQAKTMSERWAESAKASDDAVKTAQEKWAASPLNKPDGPIGQTTNQVSSLIGGLKLIGTTLAAWGVTKAIGEVIDFASELKTLAEKSGASLQGLQDLNRIAATNDVTLRRMGDALNILQQRLTTDKGAIKAVKDLGFEVETLLKMKSDEMFVELAKAIAKIPDPAERTRLAYELLGRTSKDLLPIMLADLTNLGKGHVNLSDETVRGLDTFNRVWEETKLNVMAIIGNIIGMFLQIPDNIRTIVLLGPVVLQTAIYNMGVKSVEYVKGMYEGIKTWLLDKFTDVVDSVKAKVDKVTGFFADMYDKVVGHSYVPDMIEAIGSEFAKLPSIMVEPARSATSSVMTGFSELGVAVSNEFGRMLGYAGDFGEKFGAWSKGFALNTVAAMADILLPGLGGVVQALGPYLGKAFGKVWDGLKALGTKIFGLIGSIASAIGGLFKGEGAKTNDTRDDWMKTLGGFEGSQALILKYGNDQALMDAFGKAYFASNRETLEAGIREFEMRRLELDAGGLGFAGGTHGQYLDFGAGTPVMLHGKERVMTEAEGRASGSGRPIVINVDNRGAMFPDRQSMIGFAEILLPILSEAGDNLGVGAA